MKYAASARLISRSPNIGVEVLNWADGTSTVNVTYDGMGVSQQSFRQDGHMTILEALVYASTMLRLEKK